MHLCCFTGFLSKLILHCSSYGNMLLRRLVVPSESLIKKDITASLWKIWFLMEMLTPSQFSGCFLGLGVTKEFSPLCTVNTNCCGAQTGCTGSCRMVEGCHLKERRWYSSGHHRQISCMFNYLFHLCPGGSFFQSYRFSTLGSEHIYKMHLLQWRSERWLILAFRW